MLKSPQTRDRVVAALLFAGALLVYRLSPVRQLADSNGSMLLSQSLLDQRSFALDRYLAGIPVSQEFESVEGHLYYRYPPGTSILSIPLVAALNGLGVSAVHAGGSYDPDLEVRMQAIVASLLMAALATVFYGTARLLLPWHWSLLSALAGSFGTQVWSTASRATWAHTWEILLLALALRMLLAAAAGRRALRTVTLGFLAGALYVVRPTGALPIAAIGLYLGLERPRELRRYIPGVLGVLCLFSIYSLVHFGTPLPSYYRVAQFFTPSALGTGLAGNLISPSRGLLVYVPVLCFVAWLVLRHRARLPHRRLAAAALFCVLGHLLVISTWRIWWGGHSYGPRLSACLVPWFVLLGVLGLRARLDAAVASKAERYAGALLLGLSVFMNGLGALRPDTWLWNSRLSLHGEARLWDWRRAQFLAAFVWPLPGDGANLGAGAKVAIGSEHAEPYLGKGWGAPQAGVRWTEGRTASIEFNFDEPELQALRMRIQPYLVPGRWDRQRVGFFLNGKRFGRLVLRKPTSEVRELRIPPGLLQRHNVLELRLPDARSPAELGAGAEQERLGVALWWIELR